MTQQDKDLLLRDLCARLPYGVKCYDADNNIVFTLNDFDEFSSVWPITNNGNSCMEFCKPYLRPLSSLTQEERDKFCDIGGVISYRPTDGKQYIVAFVPEALDYLNSIHADYRGLIEKGLAIEVTNDNNPYK